MNGTPVVLLFRGSLCEMSCREFEGVTKFAHEAGWSLQTIEFSTAAGTRYREGTDRSVDVKSLMRFWRPSGCIVECSGRASPLPARLFGRVPVVFLDSHPSVSGRGAVCVSSDASAIAAIAARELLSSGLSDYAYVPWPEETVWSRERGDEFARIVRMNGKRLHIFSGSAKVSQMIEHQRELARWCASLPKPCGVFAANDTLAERVVAACAMEGVSVPNDVAVVGVDDLEAICENSAVTLSSVRTDNVKAGYLAAELLARWMDGRDGKPPSGTFGAIGLVRRESSRRLAGADVRTLRALEFIRRHACEGIAPPAVAEAMGCSRRLADTRFRASTGHTILDEIHAVRLARVKELLLKPGQEIAAIPALCGYSSVEDLCRVFKSRTGLTMRQFRHVEDRHPVSDVWP